MSNLICLQQSTNTEDSTLTNSDSTKQNFSVNNSTECNVTTFSENSKSLDNSEKCNNIVSTGNCIESNTNAVTAKKLKLSKRKAPPNEIVELYVDLIGDKFWNERPYLLANK